MRESPATNGIRPRCYLEAAAIFLICIYGGYFGAAAGVLLLALLLRAGGASLAHANAGKNVMLGVANGVAALIFAFLAPVHWLAVIPLGTRMPARIPARAHRGPSRAGWADAVLIGAAGLALAVKLGFDAYG